MTVRLNLPLLELDGVTQRGETRGRYHSVASTEIRPRSHLYLLFTRYSDVGIRGQAYCSGMGAMGPKHMVLDRSRVDLSSMWSNILGSQALGAHQNFERS